MGVHRDVLDDAGDFEVSPSFVAEHLAEGVFIAEVFAGRRCGEHDGEWGVERRGGITAQERKREDVEDRRVGEEEAFLLKLSLLIPEDERRLRIQPDGVLDGGGIRVLQARADFVRRAGQMPDAALVAGVAGTPIFGEAIDTVGLLRKSIVAQFVLQVQHDQQTTRHAHGQPERVDEGVALVSPQVTQGDFEVVFQHGVVRCQLSVVGARHAVPVRVAWLSTANPPPSSASICGCSPVHLRLQLFISQRLHRIGQRRPDGLITHRRQRDGERQQASN